MEISCNQWIMPVLVVRDRVPECRFDTKPFFSAQSKSLLADIKLIRQTACPLRNQQQSAIDLLVKVEILLVEEFPRGSREKSNGRSRDRCCGLAASSDPKVTCWS